MNDNEGRHEWDENGGLDREGENVWIVQDVCDAVDRLSTRMMGDWKACRLLLQHYHGIWRKEGRELAEKDRRERDERENRERAEWGHGWVIFRSADGLEHKELRKIERNRFWDRVIKRAVVRPISVIASVSETESFKYKAIPVRTYVMQELNSKGIPVYEEQVED